MCTLNNYSCWIKVYSICARKQGTRVWRWTATDGCRWDIRLSTEYVKKRESEYGTIFAAVDLLRIIKYIEFCIFLPRQSSSLTRAIIQQEFSRTNGFCFWFCLLQCHCVLHYGGKLEHITKEIRTRIETNLDMIVTFKGVSNWQSTSVYYMYLCTQIHKCKL